MIFTPVTVSLPNDLFTEDRPLWVAKSHPTTTVGEMHALQERLEFDPSTATYSLHPIIFTTDEIFISPIKNLVRVRARAKPQGRFRRLPIEEVDAV